MSGVDIVARGLATQAWGQTLSRTRTLLSADRSGPVTFTAGSQTYKLAHAATLPGETIVGGGLLRFKGILAKYDPVAAGHAWRLRLVQGANSVLIGQNFLGASLRTYHFDHSLFVSADRRWGYAYSANVNGSPSVNTAGQVAETGASTTAAATLNPNAASSTVAFATYSATPIVETLVIDFSQAITLVVEIAGQNGDTLELLGFSSELAAADLSTATNFAATDATACWGDSLTQGTGATAVSGAPYDFPSQLRRLRTGRPIVNRGLGGQTASQIIDRLVADPIAGRLWDAIVWIGTNDASTDAVAWWGRIAPQIDRALAYRGAARTLFVNLFPHSDWPTGNAFNAALTAVDAQLAARLGLQLVDICTPLLAGGSGGTPNSSYMMGGGDTVHLNNSGYQVVRDAIDQRMTALGWG